LRVKFRQTLDLQGDALAVFCVGEVADLDAHSLPAAVLIQIEADIGERDNAKCCAQALPMQVVLQVVLA